MTPIVTIGSAGLDGLHVMLLLGVLGLGFLAYVLLARARLSRRELVRAAEDLADMKQALRSKEEVARQAELALAEPALAKRWSSVAPILHRRQWMSVSRFAISPPKRALGLPSFPQMRSRDHTLKP
jgi:hypothetical protein